MLGYKAYIIAFLTLIASGCSLDLSENGEYNRQRLKDSNNRASSNVGCKGMGGVIEYSQDGSSYCRLPEKSVYL